MLYLITFYHVFFYECANLYVEYISHLPLFRSIVE